MAEYYRNAWYAQLQKKVAELEEEIKKAIELPKVTAEDEGKVLTVDSEGKWAAEEKLPSNYSTDERVIGTWIDGKLLYEKTFNIVVSTPTVVTGTIYTGTINMSSYIQSLDMAWVDTNMSWYLAEEGATRGFEAAWYEKDSGVLNIQTQFSRTNVSATLVIRYVKTTD